MDRETAKRQLRNYSHAKPEAEVQAVDGERTPIAPTSEGQGPDDASVQERGGVSQQMAEGPWFILIPGDVQRWLSCDTEESAIRAAEKLITQGCPLVYVAKGVHCKVSSITKAMLLIERKPTVLNEGEID